MVRERFDSKLFIERMIIVGMMFLLLIPLSYAYKLQTVYNPFTTKMDYIQTENYTGYNLTANNFILAGSVIPLNFSDYVTYDTASRDVNLHNFKITAFTNSTFGSDTVNVRIDQMDYYTGGNIPELVGTQTIGFPLSILSVKDILVVRGGTSGTPILAFADQDGNHSFSLTGSFPDGIPALQINSNVNLIDPENVDAVYSLSANGNITAKDSLCIGDDCRNSWASLGCSDLTCLSDVADDAAPDSDKVLVGDGDEFISAKLSHTQLDDIGTYSHIAIDSHIDDVSNPHHVTAAQVEAVDLFSDQLLINGTKTFLVNPILPNQYPDNPNQAVSKAYVDSVVTYGNISYREAVLSQSYTTPPETANTGDRYIVPVGALGDWTGHDKEIATKNDTGWKYDVPSIGWFTIVLEDAKGYIFSEDELWVMLNAPLSYIGGNYITMESNAFNLGGYSDQDTVLRPSVYNLTIDLENSGSFRVQDNEQDRFIVDSNGNIGLGTDPVVNIQVFVKPQGDAYKGVVIRQSSATQTANLFEIQNSSGTTISNFDNNGKLNISQDYTTDKANAYFQQNSKLIASQVAATASENFSQIYEGFNFTTSTALSSSYIIVRMLRNATAFTNPTAYLTLQIYNDTGGVPSTLLYTGGTFRYGTISTSTSSTATFIMIYNFVANNPYWIVLKQSAAPTGSVIMYRKRTATSGGIVESPATVAWTVTPSNEPYYLIYGTSYRGAEAYSDAGYGIYVNSLTNTGLYADSTYGTAVSGTSAQGYGLYGSSTYNYAIYGTSTSGSAVYGISTSGYGLYGTTTSGVGMAGVSTTGTGLTATSTSGTGATFTSTSGTGFTATTDTGLGADIITNSAVPNTVQELLRITRTTSNVTFGLNGLGARLSYYLEGGSGVKTLAAYEDTLWSNSTLNLQHVITNYYMRNHTTVGVNVYSVTVNDSFAGITTGYALNGRQLCLNMDCKSAWTDVGNTSFNKTATDSWYATHGAVASNISGLNSSLMSVINTKVANSTSTNFTDVTVVTYINATTICLAGDYCVDDWQEVGYGVKWIRVGDNLYTDLGGNISIGSSNTSKAGFYIDMQTGSSRSNTVLISRDSTVLHDNSMAIGGANNYAGGYENTMIGGSGNQNWGNQTTIIGGMINYIAPTVTTRGGIVFGTGNRMEGDDWDSGMMAGFNNTMNNSGHGVILGGQSNYQEGWWDSIIVSIASVNHGYASSIIGGTFNLLEASESAIIAGQGNHLGGAGNVMLGGLNNTITNSMYGVVLAGYNDTLDGTVGSVVMGVNKHLTDSYTLGIGGNLDVDNYVRLRSLATGGDNQSVCVNSDGYLFNCTIISGSNFTQEVGDARYVPFNTSPYDVDLNDKKLTNVGYGSQIAHLTFSEANIGGETENMTIISGENGNPLVFNLSFVLVDDNGVSMIAMTNSSVDAVGVIYNDVNSRTLHIGVVNSSLQNDHNGHIVFESNVSGSNMELSGNLVANGKHFILGTGNVSGDYSTIIGKNNTVNGEGAFGIGYHNNVSGQGAVAIGIENLVTFNYGVAIGQINVVGGEGAVGIGVGTRSMGDSSFAGGANTMALGDYSTSLGIETIAQGYGATALGSNINVSGLYGFGVATHSFSESPVIFTDDYSTLFYTNKFNITNGTNNAEFCLNGDCIPDFSSLGGINTSVLIMKDSVYNLNQTYLELNGNKTFYSYGKGNNLFQIPYQGVTVYDKNNNSDIILGEIDIGPIMGYPLGVATMPGLGIIYDDNNANGGIFMLYRNASNSTFMSGGLLRNSIKLGSDDSPWYNMKGGSFQILGDTVGNSAFFIDSENNYDVKINGYGQSAGYGPKLLLISYQNNTVLSLDSNTGNIVGTGNLSMNGTAFVLGNGVATGEYSLAIGNQNNASGDYATILGGMSNKVSGAVSAVVGGIGNDVSGWLSTSIGAVNNVSGVVTFAIGMQNTINGMGNLVFGLSNSIDDSSFYNTIIGENNHMYGSYLSTIIGSAGLHNLTDSYGIIYMPNRVGIGISETNYSLEVSTTGLPLMISDGDFGDNPDTSWIWGDGWSQTDSDNTGNRFARHVAGAEGNLTLNNSNIPYEGYAVSLVFTVINLTSGNITPCIGGTCGITVTINSTNIQTLMTSTNETITFIASSDFEGEIDNVRGELLIPGDIVAHSTTTDNGTILGGNIRADGFISGTFGQTDASFNVINYTLNDLGVVPLIEFNSPNFLMSSNAGGVKNQIVVVGNDSNNPPTIVLVEHDMDISKAMSQTQPSQITDWNYNLVMSANNSIIAASNLYVIKGLDTKKQANITIANGSLCFGINNTDCRNTWSSFGGNNEFDVMFGNSTANMTFTANNFANLPMILGHSANGIDGAIGFNGVISMAQEDNNMAFIALSKINMTNIGIFMLNSQDNDLHLVVGAPPNNGPPVANMSNKFIISNPTSMPFNTTIGNNESNITFDNNNMFNMPMLTTSTEGLAIGDAAFILGTNPYGNMAMVVYANLTLGKLAIQGFNYNDGQFLNILSDLDPETGNPVANSSYEYIFGNNINVMRFALSKDGVETEELMPDTCDGDNSSQYTCSFYEVNTCNDTYQETQWDGTYNYSRSVICDTSNVKVSGIVDAHDLCIQGYCKSSWSAVNTGNGSFDYLTVANNTNLTGEFHFRSYGNNELSQMFGQPIRTGWDMTEIEINMSEDSPVKYPFGILEAINPILGDIGLIKKGVGVINYNDDVDPAIMLISTLNTTDSNGMIGMGGLSLSQEYHILGISTFLADDSTQSDDYTDAYLGRTEFIGDVIVDNESMNLVQNGIFKNSDSLGDWGTMGEGSSWQQDTTYRAARHIPGGTDTLSQQLQVVPGNTYTATYTFHNVTAGDLTASLCGNTLTTQSTNDTFTEELTCSNTDALVFTPSSDFDGLLDDVQVTLLRNFTVTIKGLAGSGNAYLCVNENGTLYRSATACS